jgi:hypothetical protein
MSAFSKQCLSGAANGLPINVVAIASAGTTIHTTPAGVTSWDEVWLWAVNTSVTDCELTLQWGGTTSPDNSIIYTVSAKDGLKCIIPGLPLQNGLIIKAFSSVANIIMMHGFVNRIVG